MIDLSRFGNDGFALVPSLFDDETVDRLCSELDSLRSGTLTSHSYAGLRNLLSQSQQVRELAQSRTLRELIEPILGPQAFATRALLFDKSETVNWWVGWHQDQFITVKEMREVPGYRGFWRKAGVLHVIPPMEVLAGMLTVRVHLDDSTGDNGALQVMRGSHRWGLLSSEVLSERLVQTNGGTQGDYDTTVTCEVPRGGALLMRPLLLHASQKATRPARRRVIHLEFAAVDLPGGLEWNERV